MRELEKLRPEVREAVREIVVTAAATRPDLQLPIATIRAELLRLAGENEDLQSGIDLDEQVWIQRDETLEGWIKRARKAEAELAALKARIAGSDAGIVTQTFIHLGSDGADTTTVEAYPPKVFHHTTIGKRVRLVVEE